MIEHFHQISAQPTIADGQHVDVQLWVPSEEVASYDIGVPKVSKKKLKEMLPWLLEDQLLRPPEELEFILVSQYQSTQPKADGSGHCARVYVVDKTSIRQWSDFTEAKGYRPVQMVPDFLALPLEDDRWTVLVESGRMLVRTGVYSGFACDPDFGWLQLQAALAAQDVHGIEPGQPDDNSDESELSENALNDDSEAPPGPLRLSVLTDTELQVPPALSQWVDQQSGHLTWSFAEPPADVNLMLRKPSASNKNLMAWWPAAAMAACLFLLMMGFAFFQAERWKKETELLRAGIDSSYTALFGEPYDPRQGDVRRQVNLKMRQREQQYFTMSTTPLVELQAMDDELSRCRDCNLVQVKQLSNGVQLELSKAKNIVAQLERDQRWNIEWEPPVAAAPAVDASGQPVTPAVPPPPPVGVLIVRALDQ